MKNLALMAGFNAINDDSW